MDNKLIWHPVPNILEMVFYEMPPNSTPTVERIVKDYEIDYYISGNGKVFLNNNAFNISSNHIMLRRPGQICKSIPSYSCYALTIDFSDNRQIAENYTRNHSGEIQALINHPCFDIMPEYMSVSSPTIYQNIFSRLYNLYHQKSDLSKNDYDIILTDLFLNCLTDSVHRINKPYTDDKIKPELQELCLWLRIHSNQKISLSDMGEKVNLSPNYLHRIFVSHFGITPNQYLQMIRFEKSCQLLTETSNSINLISEQCGFNNPSYFAKQFKEIYGLTPTDYRKLQGL